MVVLKASHTNTELKVVKYILLKSLGSNTLFKYTFKLHEMIANGISKFLEWSWQRKANKQFEEKDVR